jgi:hypothetical protein
MSHKVLARVLELVDAASLVACLVIANQVVPDAEAAERVPAGSTEFFSVGVVPLVVLALLAYRLFGRIGRGEVFVQENATQLKRMGVASAVSAIIWVVGIVAAAMTGIGDEYYSVYSTLSVALIFTVALCIVCLALALLCERAADIKSENDMTV